MSEELQRRDQILLYIKKCIRDNGSPPTRREIADRFGFSSANAAQEQLVKMAAAGMIVLTPRTSRGIQVVG